MMRAIKLATKALAIFFVALFLTRTVFVSGMAQAGVETSAGRSIYLSLRHVFGVAGAEEGETLIMSVVFITSLILVTLLTWSLSKLWYGVIRSRE
ncbi:hypothetical protein [Pseudomonas syringae]|uniref:hypothetical protein n=1 Tax=Pseudomonas syringae TaxID=317 RepID=UPI0004635672|nr:hypothetical protein [Pseudomonas syringae]